MPEKRARGFAAMDPEQQRQIASMGGRAAHQRGTAHEWDSREAAEAGRKGGKAAHHRGATADGATEQNGRPASRSEEANGAMTAARDGAVGGNPDARRDLSWQNGQTAQSGRAASEWSENEYENRGAAGAAVIMTPAAVAHTGTV